MTRPTIQIVMHGVKYCSGHCPFCSEAANTEMMRTSDDLLYINDKIYDDIKFDFYALEKAIKSHPNWKNNTRISIWGGDPLTSFSGFKDIVDLVNDIKEDKEIQFSCSTNGLALENDEIAQWVYDNHILFQLSHDGLGQKYRTGNKDPLKFDNIKELIKSKNCHSIYTILYSLNYKPLDNIKYIKESYDILPPYRRINVVRESTSQWNIRGDKADEYINQLRQIYDDIDNPLFDGWRYSLLREIKMQYRHGATPCSEFAKGKTEYSGIIDTLGKQTQCHLLDSTQTVSNPMMIKPNCCSNCKYKTTWRCDMCGIDTLPDVCDFNFKYNSFLDELSQRPDMQERIKNIRGYLKTNNIEKRKQ